MSKGLRPIRDLRPLRALKPLDRLQNLKTSPVRKDKVGEGSLAIRLRLAELGMGPGPLE